MTKEQETFLVELQKTLETHDVQLGKVVMLTKTVEDWMKTEELERNKIKTDLKEYMEKTTPMVEFFDDVTSSKKILFWVLGGLGTIGAFYLMMREIFSK